VPETKKIVDAGGLIIEVLASKVGAAQPSEADLRAWVDKGTLIVHSLIDPPGNANATLNAFGIRETAVIVDLRTMKILKKINGSTAGTPPSSIQQLLTEMLTLVTK
jgi:hypothetical protein